MTLQVGDRVRIKHKPDWPQPPGYAFAAAEGSVVKWVEYDAAMADFVDMVVCVRLESVPGEGEDYVGSTLMFLSDDLDRL